jgi:hypothetical protein
VTNQQAIRQQAEERKWQWRGHMLSKPNKAIEKSALDWNPQGVRRSECPRKTWNRTVEEEATEG